MEKLGGQRRKLCFALPSVSGSLHRIVSARKRRGGIVTEKVKKIDTGKVNKEDIAKMGGGGGGGGDSDE